MTPEQLLAVGPSVVAIAIALIGAFVQWRTRLADNSRLAAQRDADDKRWAEQRSMDESRWSNQLRAEESKSASEHQRLLQLKELENRDEQARGRLERLRTDAVKFVTVFEEALVVTLRMSEQLADACKQEEWSRADEVYEPWRNSDLPVRLSGATARMRLHGTSVGDPASAAHTELTEKIRDMVAAFAGHPSAWYVMMPTDDLFRTSIEAVVEQLGEGEPPEGSSA